MLRRRILSLWFPRLAAEFVVRGEPQLAGRPLAIIADRRGALVISSLTSEAEAAGLRPGMTLGDARAIRPDLATHPEDPAAFATFLVLLRRWAGRFTPWIAEEGDGSLVLDVTGCAHLFGGEASLAAEVEVGAARLGLSVELGLADTLGAAWAVARYAGAGTGPAFAGDAIDQEARATRSRAQKRRWERGGAPPPPVSSSGNARRIIPTGETISHLGPLTVAALRLEPQTVVALQDLGLRRIADVAAQPRAALVRRVGPEVAHRLDQALGRIAEPVSPAPPPPVFSFRLGFPEPIARLDDVIAGMDRLLPQLCVRLAEAGRGLRQLRLRLMRSDGGVVQREIGLARPTIAPEAIRPILKLSLGELDAGFGFDAMRVEAVLTEPMDPPSSHRLPVEAASAHLAPRGGNSKDPHATDADRVADLLGRLGTRLGLEALVRLYPADSHIPEKATTEMAAAFAPSASGWIPSGLTRPAVMFEPEPITSEDDATPPARFVWRRQPRRRIAAWGPERLTPEWWLDEPAWRSGPRNYWRVETEEGLRLWLYETLGGEVSAGWFAQGTFA